ncbi:MAG: antibiotic biosynthesis monooxygenase [Mycobacterium sp.]|nr:antibiotic biosynthesis monooxygenase [Mycobacterium sp.]
MPIIRSDAGIVTQINTFTVAETDQQTLVELLTEAARFSQDVSGWLSASLHRSVDGTRVVNYAQSDSMDSARLVIERLRAAGYLERNAALATAHPGLYEVVFTLER